MKLALKALYSLAFFALSAASFFSTNSLVTKVSRRALLPVAREGNAANPLGAGTYGQITPTITMNDSGAVAFQSLLGGVAGAQNAAIFSGLPGALPPVVQKGDPAPGSGGGSFQSFQATSISGTGHVAFRGTLKSSASIGVGSSNNGGLWSKVGGALSLVAREGDQVPGAPAGVLFSSFTDFAVSDDGSVCFIGFVSGPGINSSNDGGFFSNAGGAPTMLLSEGGIAPGTDGAVVRAVSRFASNGAGEIAVLANLVPGVGDASSGTPQGLWLSNSDTGEQELALRTGSTFDLGAGDVRGINIISIDKTTTVAGGTGGVGRVLNDLGHLAVILSFDLGSGVFVVGSLP